jgi:hypothetical protein
MSAPYEPATTPSESDAFNVATFARRLFSLALLLYGAYDLAHPGRGSILAGVDLAIHETGHLVFGPFGELLGVAGGTLFQLIMPLLFVGYFARRGDGHSASVALWWVAQNCGHIATYVADARVQELPLVGGGEHDWAYLLGRFGLLARDTQIAHGVRTTGFVLVLAASAWGLATARRSAERAAEGDPD